MAVAAVPVTLIFAIGAVDRRAGQTRDWLLAPRSSGSGSALFAIYGLAVCLVFRGPNASGIASGMIVVMAFLGNVFTPMSGLHARHRPLHAAVRVRRARRGTR